MYHASTLSEDVKTFAARLFLEQERRGVKRESFLEDMINAGYSVSKASFNRYIAAVRAGGTAVTTSEEKLSGRPTALTEDQVEIAAGWVLQGNLEGREVHMADYVKFVHEAFQVSINERTGLNYLSASGFSSQISKAKGGYGLDRGGQERLLWEWVLEQRRAGIFHHDLAQDRVGGLHLHFPSHRSTTHFRSCWGRNTKERQQT